MSDATRPTTTSEPARKGRRGHGEGAIFRDSSGMWVARIDAGTGPTGKRRRVVRKAKTKAEVLRRIADARRELDRSGGAPVDQSQTVDQYLSWWLDAVVPLRVKASTATGYRYVVDHFLAPRVGRHRLGKLSPAHVQTMVGELTAEGYTPHTIRQVVGVLSGALNHALRSELLPRNVCTMVQLPKVVRSVDDDTLEPADVRCVLDKVAGTRWEPFYTLALGYGLRQGELLALRWADVDLDAEVPFLRVVGTLKWPARQGWMIDEPKTAASVRVVELAGDTVARLRQWRRTQAEQRLAAGPAWTDHGFVFTTEGGTPIHDRNALRRWHEELKALRLDRRPFHATRRTAVTNMAAAGVPMEVCAAIVGHSSTRVTTEIYNRVRPRGRAEAASIIDRVLAG